MTQMGRGQALIALPSLETPCKAIDESTREVLHRHFARPIHREALALNLAMLKAWNCSWIAARTTKEVLSSMVKIQMPEKKSSHVVAE